MEYISEAQTPTEVLALSPLPATTLDITGLPKQEQSLMLVLDGIGDPGNVGTLLRSADVAGASHCVLTPNSADVFGPKTVRASAGSLFHLHVSVSKQETLAGTLQTALIPLVTAVAHGGENCFAFSWPPLCALVLGHETRGVSDALESAATHRVTIPNYGRAESLNVAAAGAVLLFAWRQAMSRGDSPPALVE
jgi:TrmH family RNA methyltransferase